MNQYKLAKIGRYLIYLTLFTPLFIVPKTLWEFVFVRNLIFYIFVTILLGVSILYIYKYINSIIYKVNLLFWLILGFLIVRILSGIFGVDFSISFFGTQPRMDGNLGFLIIFAWLSSILLFINTRKEWNQIFKICVFVAFISSIFALIQPYFPQEGFLAGKGGIKLIAHRIIGTLGNSSFFAGYIGINIFFALYLFIVEKSKKWLKYIWLSLAFFFVIIMLLTQTRGALLSLGVAGIFIFLISLIYYAKRSKKSFFNIIFTSFPFVLSGMIALFVPGIFDRFKDISFITTGASTRIILWKIGLHGFIERWFLGWGSENYSYIFSKFYDPNILKFSFYETWADKPHNYFIEILSSNGILGFAFFIAILVTAFYFIIKLAWKEEFLANIFLGAGLLFYLGHIFFSFDILEIRLMIFIILGFIIFLTPSIQDKVSELSHDLLKKLFLALFIVVMISLAIIGVRTIKGTILAARAREAIVINNYSVAKKSLVKLVELEGPYSNGNWENLSDIILNADSSGRLPASVVREIIPRVIDRLHKAVTDNPDNFSYNYRLAQMYNLAGIYIDKRYFNNAETFLEKSKLISPLRQVSDLLLAQVYYYNRDLASAIKILEDMIAKNPDITQPYWYLGILYNASGDTEKAYTYMSKAVKGGYSLGFSEEVLYVNVLGEFNKYEEMVDIYKSIISKDSKNPSWWANLATIYLEIKKYDEARDATRQAIFLDPTFGSEGEDFLKKIDRVQNGDIL